MLAVLIITPVRGRERDRQTIERERGRLYNNWHSVDYPENGDLHNGAGIGKLLSLT